ncbi:MAG: (2Fe-2S)-binding protein [Deltaproteobacteria bacterium]|nr:(2Fe-2S)-binding protein [Deltaproteobacteria bacterium]
MGSATTTTTTTTATIPVTVDGQTIEVKPGTTVLEAARMLKISIPTLCHHSAVEAYGACRVCMTEIEVRGKKRMVTACNFPIREPLAVFAESDATKRQRRGVLSMMLARWPNVPAIQTLAKRYGVQNPGYKHPLRNEAPDACILCGLCVKACSEMVWEDVIAFAGRGARRRVAMPFGKQSERCTGCGTCAYICPTGAIKVADEKNNPVDPARIRKYGFRLTKEMATLDDSQCKMRRVGTAHLVEIMDAYDLLPTHNYKFGKHAEIARISSPVWTSLVRQNVPDGCWVGCQMSCAKAVDDFVPRTGPYKGRKVLVDGPEYETVASCGSNIGVFEPHDIIELNFYCDTYGIDTISFGTACAFAMECYEAGVLDKRKTGGLDLKFGNATAALELLHHMSRGEGFGVLVGQGIRQMKRIFAERFGGDPKFLHDIGMEAKGLEYSEYVSKESLAQQAGYAMAQKGPQHDEAWLIFMDMVNKQLPTFEKKAEALYYFPMWRTWFGLMGLCKLPWNDVEPEDNAKWPEPNKVPGHVEGYENFLSGMIGGDFKIQDILKMSERVYNFQRVFAIRMGHGRREDDRGPYRAMGPVTAEEYESRAERYDGQLKELVKVDPAGKSTAQKMALLRQYREEQYEGVLDAVYKRRGWTRNGTPTPETLKGLGIDYPWVVEVVKARMAEEGSA